MEEAGVGGGGWCWNVKMLFNYRVDELSFKNTVNSLESDPPLVHNKMVAYGRWSSTRKIKKTNLLPS